METEIIRHIKQQFYTFRNGMLADRLRSAGDPHNIIFGLNLPQIINISGTIKPCATLAQALWDNTSTRESQLIAPMIYPISEYSEEVANNWIRSITTIEVADILCHKLLRYTPFSLAIYNNFITSDNDIERYTALRLAFNLLILNKNIDLQQLKEDATNEITRSNPINIDLAHSMLNEIASKIDFDK
ncbi:MAG: DNA alkylation repair protein [Muribaculaceae bacterium]